MKKKDNYSSQLQYLRGSMWNLSLLQSAVAKGKPTLIIGLYLCIIQTLPGLYLWWDEKGKKKQTKERMMKECFREDKHCVGGEE